MINKQSLLFLTLTSLVLVLSVYYITMPNELLLKTNNGYNEIGITEVNKEEINIDEVDAIKTLKSVLEEQRLDEKKVLNSKLLKEGLTIEEKNDVYEELREMNDIETIELNLEKKIHEVFSMNSFVKMDEDIVDVTLRGKENSNIAVKIMNLVEEELNRKVYVSVTFKE